MTICDVRGRHRHAILAGESIQGLRSVAVPLANDLRKSDHLQLSISHFGLSMLPNVVKETAVTMALNIQKKTRRLNELAKHRSQICKTRHKAKFASLKLLQLRRAASATQWTEFESNSKSTTSPGESCARLPEGLRLHRHPWCLCRSTWSAQKGTVGIHQPRGKVAYRKRYVYAV